MTTTRWMITGVLALTTSLGLTACDGDEGDAGDEAAESGDESTGGDTEGDETLGKTDADVGSDLDADGDTDGDGPGDFGEVESDTDEPSGCAVNATEVDCAAAEGCAAVFGNAILPDGEGWCSAPEAEFIGCVSSGNLCPPLEQTLCDGDQMWTTNDCVPDNLMVCEAPGDITDICA